MYCGNDATNITYFSVEHAKIMDAVFHRSDVSIMWTMDSLSNQSSNLHFSRQKVSKRNFSKYVKNVQKTSFEYNKIMLISDSTTFHEVTLPSMMLLKFITVEC